MIVAISAAISIAFSDRKYQQRLRFLDGIARFA